MEIQFNPRDNGACPFCRRLASCPIQEKIGASVREIRDPSCQGMQLVIYTCPSFVETT
jgi:hypothetical protein